MEESSQLHASAALPPWTPLPTATHPKEGWVDPRAGGEEENLCREPNLGRPARSFPGWQNISNPKIIFQF